MKARELDEKDFAKWMHDYAGQSDAKEKAILFAKFITKHPDTDEAYEQLYQQFLNREEGKK
jgi:hypothetical protein